MEQTNTFFTIANNKEDPSVIELHPDTLDKLSLFRGDCVAIKGNVRETGTIIS